jgi:hypothetical protein
MLNSLRLYSSGSSRLQCETMFPFELSLFGTGLMITIAVLVILYLIVLIKLNPSTEGDRIPREPLTERQVKPTMYNEVEEETVESIERQETVPPVPVEIEKTDAHGCSHYFGYLGEHPKNTPIPNECLTCIKIMECFQRLNSSQGFSFLRNGK